MRGESGLFVVDQPEWTRDRFGNWLQSTNYGIHSAIDIYSTQHGVGEPVRSPVDGTVYKVYHVDAARDDPKRNKVVNIFGRTVVGPGGERVFYRFHHLSEIRVSRGEPVRRGQVIGLTGHTGFDAAIGDHLHFEMRLNPSCFGFEKDDDIFATIPVNPYNYLLEWYQAARPKRSD
jgi:murein DD-endopeptidase MepM/ murein hydrolase activator NlpD